MQAHIHRHNTPTYIPQSMLHMEVNPTPISIVRRKSPSNILFYSFVDTWFKKTQQHMHDLFANIEQPSHRCLPWPVWPPWWHRPGWPLVHRNNSVPLDLAWQCISHHCGDFWNSQIKFQNFLFSANWQKINKALPKVSWCAGPSQEIRMKYTCTLCTDSV